MEKGKLKIVSKNPENTKIATFLGVKEGTIRARRKKFEQEGDPLYRKNILNYIKHRRPFFTIEEYLEIENIKKPKNEILKDIEEGRLNGVIQEDNAFLPTITEDYLQTLNRINSSFPITFTNSNHKGGVSKTSNSINLASIYSSIMGLRTLLVDFDPQGNASQAFGYYDGNDGKTIIDLLFKLDDDDIEEQIKETIIDLNIENRFATKSTGCLHLLPNCDDKVDKVEDMPNISKSYGTVENTLLDLLKIIKNNYDIIIIDTPPRADLMLRTAIMASDSVVLSLKTEPFAKTGMPKIIGNIDKYSKAYRRVHGKDISILGGIISAYEKNANLFKTNLEAIKEDLESETNGNSRVFDTIIPKAVIVPESQQGDGAVLYYDPNDEIVKYYMDVSVEILDKILENKMMEEM